jgi:NADH-quinone oxidoreductase subunit B
MCEKGGKTAFDGKIKAPHDKAMAQFFTSRLNDVLARLESHLHVPWVMTQGCCSIEMESVQSATYDWKRLGVEKMGEHPSQCDLLIISGWINDDFRAEIEAAYRQLTGQKIVMVVGACAISGSPFYNKNQENQYVPASEILPVDVFVPGCPPRPESILDALKIVKQKILPGPDQRTILYGALKQTPPS